MKSNELNRRNMRMVTTFLYSLGGGMLVVMATGRVEQIAGGFLRLVGMIVFAAACAVITWQVLGDRSPSTLAGDWAVRLGVGLAVVSATVVFLSPLSGRMRRSFTLLCMFGGLTGLGAGCLSYFSQFDYEARVGVALASGIVISQILGAILLGSVTVAWLLGHAYLTATRMTIAPLRYFTRLLSWAVVVRGVFLVTSVLTAWTIGDGSDSSVIARIGQSWLIMSLRVGVGLAAVGVFAYMVSDCVRRRATQSATGILYFSSIFAYVGELASQHLIAECGWPM